MSVVPFTASQDSDSIASAQTDAADARRRMLDVTHKLQDVAGDIEAIQHALASQQELEQLLKQGKAHLQDLRGRLQQISAERDRLQAEVADSAHAHQRTVEELERHMDDARAELQVMTADRNRTAAQLAEQITAHEEFARERADERNTFKRMLDEASFTQGEMAAELEEQRQQIDTLREAALRAQSFAREIMKAHETAQAIPARTKS